MVTAGFRFKSKSLVEKEYLSFPTLTFRLDGGTWSRL